MIPFIYDPRKTDSRFLLSVFLFHANGQKKRAPETSALLEASPRFELGIRELQSHALPLGYDAVKRADYEARTRYLHLGKVALYQMS